MHLSLQDLEKSNRNLNNDNTDSYWLFYHKTDPWWILFFSCPTSGMDLTPSFPLSSIWRLCFLVCCRDHYSLTGLQTFILVSLLLLPHPLPLTLPKYYFSCFRLKCDVYPEACLCSCSCACLHPSNVYIVFFFFLFASRCEGKMFCSVSQCTLLKQLRAPTFSFMCVAVELWLHWGCYY